MRHIHIYRKCLHQINTMTTSSGVMLWILSNDKRKQKIICKLDEMREITGRHNTGVIKKKVWCYSKNYFNCNFLNDFVSLSNCWMSKRKRLVWSAFLGIFAECYSMVDLNIPKQPLQPSQTVHNTAHNCLKPLWKISKEDFRRPDIKKIIFFWCMLTKWKQMRVTKLRLTT